MELFDKIYLKAGIDWSQERMSFRWITSSSWWSTKKTTLIKSKHGKCHSNVENCKIIKSNQNWIKSESKEFQGPLKFKRNWIENSIVSFINISWHFPLIFKRNWTMESVDLNSNRLVWLENRFIRERERRVLPESLAARWPCRDTWLLSVLFNRGDLTEKWIKFQLINRTKLERRSIKFAYYQKFIYLLLFIVYRLFLRLFSLSDINFTVKRRGLMISAPGIFIPTDKSEGGRVSTAIQGRYRVNIQ